MNGPDRPSIVDLVTQAVMDRIHQDIEPRVQEVVQNVQLNAQAQLDEFLHELPTMQLPIQEPITDAKADAKSRAGRTALQGGVATIIVAASLAIAGVISGGEFDFTSSGDWKAVMGAAIGAVVAAGAAYIQRIVAPPRGGSGQ